MIKLNKKVVLGGIFLLLIIMIIGCSNKDIYDLAQFEKQMKAKNYEFQLKAVEKDFLPTTRKRMIIGKEAIDIYVYNSNKEAEKDAKRIDEHGFSYTNGNKSVKVGWVSQPHFYKKGNIIVQYIGQNEKIISDLKDIFGQQFAGSK